MKSTFTFTFFAKGERNQEVWGQTMISLLFLQEKRKKITQMEDFIQMRDIVSYR